LEPEEMTNYDGQLNIKGKHGWTNKTQLPTSATKKNSLNKHEMLPHIWTHPNEETSSTFTHLFFVYHSFIKCHYLKIDLMALSNCETIKLPIKTITESNYLI
jgi:hypothetical protein